MKPGQQTHEKSTVISGGVTSLGSDIHDGSARKKFTSLDIAERNDERERTTLDESSVLSIGSMKLSHNDRVICCSTETSDPPLHGSESRRLKNESL